MVARDPLAQREGRFAGIWQRLVAGAVAQGVETRGHVPEVLGDDVDDAFLALQPAAAIEQGGAQRGPTEAFEDSGPDDQIGDPGLVFEGDEDDAVGAARALPDQDEPGYREPPVDRQGGEIGGGGEALLAQLRAQKAERAARYRPAPPRGILA